jgi:uncharacterized protein YbjT (DUF2867 family)
MKVLVTGATGKQGGHVAQRLLSAGHSVHAFTRRPDSPAAQKLSQSGATLVTGDLLDVDSIKRAAEPVDAIFAMTTPFEAGTETEIRQGLALADAAKDLNKYLLFTSIAQANKATGVPHFDSKRRIEQHIQEIGAEATILGPAYFMENLTSFQLEQIKQGVYASPLDPNRPLTQLALDDLAAFALLVLENKPRFVGQRIDLASDTLTGTQEIAILSEAMHKTVTYFHVPMVIIQGISDDLSKMFRWLEKTGFSTDPSALRRDYPEIPWTTFETFAKKQDWATILS